MTKEEWAEVEKNIATQKAMCKKIFELPETTYKESPRVDYVKETFMDKPAELCGFTGFMKEELSAVGMGLEKALSIMNDLVLAAVSIGRDYGWDDALRRFGGSFGQLLLKNKEK